MERPSAPANTEHDEGPLWVWRIGMAGLFVLAVLYAVALLR